MLSGRLPLSSLALSSAQPANVIWPKSSLALSCTQVRRHGWKCAAFVEVYEIRAEIRVSRLGKPKQLFVGDGAVPHDHTNTQF